MWTVTLCTKVTFFLTFRLILFSLLHIVDNSSEYYSICVDNRHLYLVSSFNKNSINLFTKSDAGFI